MKQDNHVGIVGIEYALPSLFIDQNDVADVLGWDVGKIKVGLGLNEFSAANFNEDPVSLALTAVNNLMNKYDIKPADVGRIEVGTEGNFDSAKSIKSYLMDLFTGNTSISGCDTTHACYGGTNALLNAMAWMESSLWDKRYIIVVSTDISVYKEKSALPTCGGGAVAILLGPNCVFKIVPSTLVHYFSNEYDFMKPKQEFPFPILQGRESVVLYNKGFNDCLEQLKSKVGNNDFFDYIVCHTPYSRLVEKACIAAGISKEKYGPSLYATSRNGNSYTSSLYFSLIGLLHNYNAAVGERILMFSFGAGLASSMYCLERVREGCDVSDFSKRLDMRRKIPFKEFLIMIEQSQSSDQEVATEDVVFDGFYLSKIVNYGRYYKYISK